MSFVLCRPVLSAVLMGSAGLLISTLACRPAAAQSCFSASKPLGMHRVLRVDTHSVTVRQLEGRITKRLAPKEVVLTFDDGPSPLSTKIVLTALRRHCTKATFFMLGRSAKAYPHIAKQVASAGHTVGSHGYAHRNLAGINRNRARKDVEKGVQAVRAAIGGRSVSLFRFPYLSANRHLMGIMENLHLSAVSADIDARDYRIRTKSRLVKRVMRQLDRRGKGVILLHDTKKVTARALPALLTALRDSGYKVVHLVPGSGTPVTIARTIIPEFDPMRRGRIFAKCSDAITSKIKPPPSRPGRRIAMAAAPKKC